MSLNQPKRGGLRPEGGRIANILSIAGTDPTGAVGSAADIKTISALGGYGMAVVTAVVAQNAHGVRAVAPMAPQLIADQLDAVFEDIRVDAVKIGMISDAGMVEVIAERLRHHGARNIVLDPVMVASSGHRLTDPAAIAALSRLLLPLCLVFTPNLPEAAVLLGRPEPQSLAAMEECLDGLRDLGAQWVLLKGGHLEGSADSTDLLQGPSGEVIRLPAPRVRSRGDRGTGCALSAAIATLLPGRDVETSAREAKAWLQGALTGSDLLEAGRGRGPLHHFHQLWPGKG